LSACALAALYSVRALRSGAPEAKAAWRKSRRWVQMSQMSTNPSDKSKTSAGIAT
jgi:hypothetical protein